MGKKRLATKMVEYFSRNLGLDALEVVFVEAMHFKNKHISATFNPDIYRISLNKDWLEDAPAIEIIRVAAHETRHAYQKAYVDFPMYFKGRERRKTIDIWKQVSNHTGCLMRTDRLRMNTRNRRSREMPPCIL